MAESKSRITVLLRSEETAGVLALVETRAPAGSPGPRLHRHEFDETFYVLEGELTFQLVDELVTAGPGEVVFAPRGVPHTFANPRDEPAHTLVVVTPAGFEAYFEALAAAIADRGGFPPVGELVALGIAHGSLPA